MFNTFKPLISIILVCTAVGKETAGKEFDVVHYYLTLTVEKQQLAGYAEEYPHALAVPSARKY